MAAEYIDSMCVGFGVDEYAKVVGVDVNVSSVCLVGCEFEFAFEASECLL